jgi:hypothetical protein
MATATMTYNSLLADVLAYCERANDAALVAQLSRLVSLAENRVATDLKILGDQKTVTSNFAVASGLVVKPVYWRDTISFNVTADTARVQLLLRTYEYCRNFWPDPALTGVPRFYADYDFEHFVVVPTPTLAYEFELLYHARKDPLSDANQTNWFTFNAPQLLFYAVMCEAQLFLKNAPALQLWDSRYAESRAGFGAEDGGRAIDRNTSK